MTTKAPRPYSRNSHIFRFKFSETGRMFTAKAKVRVPRRVVELVLTADDVRRSIRLNGVGNTQTCAMAVCALEHKDAFPHPVAGFIDWFYRRAYVVSRLDANGMPRECYVYDHHDPVAQLNDSKGGQRLLLKQLEAKGDRVVRLHPPHVYANAAGRPRGRNTGERSQAKTLSHGAKARFAMAQLGAVNQ